MRLPTNEDCIRCVKELLNDPALTEWEQKFLESNITRKEWTTEQKYVVHGLMEKFEV